METVITIDDRRYVAFRRTVHCIQLMALADNDVLLRLSVAEFEELYARGRLSCVRHLRPFGP